MNRLCQTKLSMNYIWETLHFHYRFIYCIKDACESIKTQSFQGSWAVLVPHPHNATMDHWQLSLKLQLPSPSSRAGSTTVFPFQNGSKCVNPTQNPLVIVFHYIFSKMVSRAKLMLSFSMLTLKVHFLGHIELFWNS